MCVHLVTFFPVLTTPYPESTCHILPCTEQSQVSCFNEDDKFQSDSLGCPSMDGSAASVWVPGAFIGILFSHTEQPMSHDSCSVF